MKKIPITLEQYECSNCKKKWYINAEDKIENEMLCPYGCGSQGNLIREFGMMIHNYEEYVNGEEMTLDGEGIKFKGVD